MKRIFSIVLALTLVLSLGTTALAADSFLDLADGQVYEVTEHESFTRLTIDETSTLTAPAGYVPVVTVDGYLKTIAPDTAYAFYGNTEVYPLAEAIVGQNIRGASAVFAEDGASVSLADETILSYGYISGEYRDDDGNGILTEEEWYSDTSNEYGSKFGMAAGVLATGEGTSIDLDGVTILGASDSTSNGAFAANGAVINIANSTVITNNSQGHGLDATFGGSFTVENCVIRTNGGSSSALSTDFGGGYFLVKDTYAESNTIGSGGIYAAGSSIFILEDSTLHANKSEAIMCAHNNSVVVCKDCYLYGPEIFDGHQAMPSPANASGDTTFTFNCTFEAVDNAIIHEQGGVTTHYIIGCDTTPCSAEYAIAVEYEDGMGAGKVYVNLWDTEITGDIYCYEGGVVELNLYGGAVFTGEVIKDGECDVTINVYNGGQYNGEYDANIIDETVEAPVYTADTYGSIDWIMNESGLWTQGNSWSSYQSSWETYVQPVIEAASGNVNGQENTPTVILASGEAGDVDMFDLYIQYMKSQLIEGAEFYDEFSAALDSVHEAGYDESTMPFEMFISNGALGYEDFAAYYQANGQFPPAAAF
jgi:hypothetical protein